MAQNIQLKRSSLPGKVPDTGSLNLGEIAINTYDGKVFLKKSGSIESVESIVTTNSINTGSITLTKTGSFGELVVTQDVNIQRDLYVVNDIIGNGDIDVLGNITGSNLLIKGTLTAQSYIVSSSVVNMTTQFASGSTIFGNTSDDTHQFTGSVDITGSGFINSNRIITSADTSSFATTGGYPASGIDYDTDTVTVVDFNNESPQFLIDYLYEVPVGTEVGLKGFLGNTSGSTLVVPANDYIAFVIDDVEVARVTAAGFEGTSLPDGLVSGSSQLTSSYDTRYVISGSITQTTWDNIASKPGGIISSSTQLNNTTIENLTIQNLTTINETASVIYSSGSNRFGDFGNDTHEFTGSVQISGSVTTIGNINGINLTTFSSSINTTLNSLTESKVTHIVSQSGGLYYIDGVQKPSMSFVPGLTYRFDTTIPDNPSHQHPFKFSTSPNGPTQYVDGVTSGSNYIQIETSYNTPDLLYYYCTIHNGMGNAINVLKIDKLLTAVSSSFDTRYALSGSVASGGGLDTRSQILSQSVAAETWSFNHNLGSQYPIVSVYGSTGEIIQPQTIKAVNINNLEITFGTPIAGVAVASLGSLTEVTGKTIRQDFTASVSWSFNHNLGDKYVMIQAFDTSDQMILPAEIKLANTTSSIITFSEPVEGYALATIGGDLPSISASYEGYTLQVQSGLPIWASIVSASVSNALTASYISPNVLTSSYDTRYVLSGSITQTTWDNIASKPGGIVSSSTQIKNYGDFATTGSNTFNGNINITGSLTASGLIYPTTDGTEFSYIQTDGAGNLSFVDVTTTYDTIHNGEGSSLLAGTPLYVSGSNGANPIVYRADASNPLKMPVTYIAAEEITTNGRGILLGEINGVNTTGYPAGTTIYVAEGGGWSSNRPSGSSSIVQVLGIVTKEGSGGKGLVLNPGPATLPNLQTGYIWVGNGTNQPIIFPSASLATTGSNTFRGTQTLSGSIIPATDNTYDLGSATYQWRDIYVSSGSLYIDGTKVLGSTGNELQITTDVGQSIKILEAGSDSIILQSADGDIQLKTSGGGNLLFDPTTGLIDVRGTFQIQDGYKVTSSGGNTIQFGNDIGITGSINTTGNINGVNVLTLQSTFNTFTGSSNTTLSGLNTYTASVKNAINVIGQGTSSVTTIYGNLVVEGTTLTISASNLAVADNMIYLNDGNEITDPDLGIAGNYNDGTYAHTGIFSDASDSHTWKVYKGYVPEPSQSIDITHGTFTLADFQAGTLKGAIAATNGVVSGSSQVIGILSSLNTYTGSNDTTNTAQNSRLTTIESVTGSYETKGRGIVSGSSQITLSSTTGGGTSAAVQFGSLGIGTAASTALPVTVYTSSANVNNVIAEFYNGDYTSGTKNFIRVRNNVSIGSTYSSYFGQGQDGNTYIVSNDFTRGGDIVINANTGKTTIKTGLDVTGSISTTSNVTIGTSNAGQPAMYITRVGGFPTIKGSTANGGDGQIVIDSVSNSAGVYLNNYVSGSVYLATGGGTTYVGQLTPHSNNSFDLGSSVSAWRNIYTNDLHLSNEGKPEGNDVDGTTGNWTIQEGAEHLYIINNKTGKKFKFSLEEIQ